MSHGKNKWEHPKKDDKNTKKPHEHNEQCHCGKEDEDEDEEDAS